MMDRDALLAYLRSEIDEEVAVRWTDVALIRYLNIEYRNLCNAIKQKRQNYYEKEGTITTIVGNRLADLPTDHSGAIIAITYDNAPLMPRDRREFVYLMSDSRAQPKYFDFLGGEKVWLYPVPDKIYTLDVVHEYLPDEMTVGTDVPKLPPGSEVLTVWGSIIQAKLKDYQDLRDIADRYKDVRKEMLQGIRPRQTFKSRRVRSV